MNFQARLEAHVLFARDVGFFQPSADKFFWENADKILGLIQIGQRLREKIEVIDFANDPKVEELIVAWDTGLS